MKKEEVLEKSRKEKNDERSKLIERNSSFYGLTYSSILLCAISIFKDMKGFNTLDITAAVFFNAGITTLYIYIKNKRIGYLIISILTFAISIYTLINFFYDIL